MEQRTLLELIEQIESLDSEAIIYAMKLEGEWRPESLAVLRGQQNEFDEGEIPLSIVDGGNLRYEYFLEVDIAHEVICVRESILEKSPLTPAEAIEAVIYYAENDACLPL